MPWLRGSVRCVHCPLVPFDLWCESVTFTYVVLLLFAIDPRMSMVSTLLCKISSPGSRLIPRIPHFSLREHTVCCFCFVVKMCGSLTSLPLIPEKLSWLTVTASISSALDGKYLWKTFHRAKEISETFSQCNKSNMFYFIWYICIIAIL